MAYSMIINDTFTRANTSAGSGANSTNVTGPATYYSPSTGGNYLDLEGNHWEISGNSLIAINESGGSEFTTGLLLRPTAENIRDGQAAITFTPGSNPGSAAVVVARFIGGSGCYGAYLYQNGSGTTGPGTFAIAKLGPGGGTQTVLTSNGSFSLTNTTSYIITLTATGASPTTLTATIATAAAPGTILDTLTTTDSTSALQVAGQWGISTNAPTNSATTSGNTFTNFTTYQLSSGSAANITISPTSATVATGGTQNFSVGLDGTLASGITLTVTPATTIGTLSPATLTFTGTGAQPSAQSVTLTAPGTAGSGTLSGTHSESGGSQTLNDFASVAITVTSASSLAIGTLTATPSSTGVTLSLSAALSGGSGSGYSYAIYRGTDPNFTEAAGMLLATVGGLPYTDTSAGPGVQYYYGVQGSDSAANTVNALPAGLGSWSPGSPAYAPAQLQTRAMNIVFVGDSITYGAGVSNAGTVNSPTMPYFCITKLKRLLGIRSIYGSNNGVSGYTLTDWAPAGSTYAGAKSAMTTLVTANLAALPIFSIMLGTNDSASSGTNNSPAGAESVSVYTPKLQALVTQMLADFPACKVFIHLPPWYSPNTQNSSVYLQAGLSVMVSYRAATSTVVAGYAATNPGQVFLGDTYAFQYFAQNYQAELQPDTSGPNGTFYLHPAGTAGSNGLIGTQSLGEMHAQAIAGALLGGIANRWTH
jgi:lysophospholipase L1-like esterase